MTTYEVPLSMTINVSLSATPSGLADFNTNSIAIFSNETATFSEPYRAYMTPASVAQDFGTEALTYKMANALFNPVPNFRTGGGVLYVFPFAGVNATASTLTTEDISANVENFKTVKDGALNLTIDGVDTLITGLNFTAVATLEDVVTVIKGQNPDVNIEVKDNKIIFTSRKLGANGSVAIKTASSGTDLNGATYLNGANATSTTGVNATGDKLSDAVIAGLQQVYFGGVLTTQYADDETLQANAKAIQSQDCTYYEVMPSMKDIAITGKDIKSAGLGKTRTLGYTLAVGKEAIATYATVSKSVNYSGTNTANTLNLKTLTGIPADTGLNDTYVLSAQKNGVDIYGNTGGLSVVYSNDNNGYTDDIENQLWLKKALEVAGFNFLRQTNTKIPQTEQGVAGLRNAYAQVCEQAIRNGVAGAGTWNSAVPFGDPEDFKRNIEEKGYYIYSIPVAQQSQTDREARKAPVCNIALKFTSAIHSSEVIVNIER